jgi:cytochrome c-type biogenesis protein CcmH/NrfG
MSLTEFLLVGAVGGGIIAVLFATFKGAAREAGADEPADSGIDEARKVSAERAELEERRSAVLRSLEEIEADRGAGNLSDADYEALRQRYEGEAAALARQLSALGEEPLAARAAEEAAPTGGRSGILTAVAWTAGSVAFVALAWLVLSSTLRPRGGDDAMTGSLPGQEMRSTPAGSPVGAVDPERLAQLERSVAEDPHNVEALVELGHLYLTLQRYDELREVTAQALQLDPDNPEALTHLGMLLFSMGHPEGVMTTFDRALEIDPNFAEALQFKGMVAFMNRDFATATQAWERYLEVVPPDQVSPRIQAMLEMARQSAGAGDSPQS